MVSRKLLRVIREIYKNELVDETMQDRMAAAVERNEEIKALKWWKDRRSEMPHRLYTPYGTLEVWPGLGWHVNRDRLPLVHARSPRSAVFTSVAAAKAAALVHLRDGFGTEASNRDGLWWKNRQPEAEPRMVDTSGGFPIDPSLSDDHEWGRQRLQQLLKASLATANTATAFDEALVSDLKVFARSWQLPTPQWTKRAHGCFELNTPYGILVIRRLVGLTIERNGWPLVWWQTRKKVIFDKLEHARTSALVHGPGCDHLILDGTRWEKPADRVNGEERSVVAC